MITLARLQRAYTWVFDFQTRCSEVHCAARSSARDRTAM